MAVEIPPEDSFALYPIGEGSADIAEVRTALEALGWEVRRLRERTMIEESALIDTSHALWGSGSYGVTAVDLLGFAQCRAELHDEDSRRFSNRPPFPLKPLPFTQEHLASFVNADGWYDHTFSGALGKAADTLLITAGVIDRPRTNKQSKRDQPFITAQQLRENASAQLQAGPQATLHSYINTNLANQIKRELDDTEEPIIVEGAVRLEWIRQYGILQKVTYEQISVPSLQRYGRGISDRARSVKPFLAGLRAK